MKKDIGTRSFVEMYLFTKEDKNLFDRCVQHLNSKENDQTHQDSSSKILSPNQTLNSTSDQDKTNDSKEDPSYKDVSSEEIKKLVKEYSRF